MKRRLHIPLACCLCILMGSMGTQRLMGQVPKFLVGIGLGHQSAFVNRIPLTAHIFPQHILQNPQGYAPLCRLELKIERQSPVGIWLNLDGNRQGQVANPGWASLRFKVPISGR